MTDREPTGPTIQQLRVFAWTLPFVVAALGAYRWHAGSPRAAVAIWIVGGALALPALVHGGFRRALYRGWMRATAPIGWLVAAVVLAIAFVIVVTPIAIALRLLGRDPLARRSDRTAPTYWVARKPTTDRTRYFRPF